MLRQLYRGRAGGPMKLADDHWAYIRDLLLAHNVGDYTVNIIGFHYRSAFKHGYKHGQEDAKGQETQTCYTGLCD